jgi:hypothetical protein
MSEQNAVISNRIYFRYRDDTHLKELIKALTYKIEVKKKTTGRTKFSNIEIIKNYKLLPQGIISIPQGRMDLVPPGTTIIDRRVYNEVPFPTPLSELREGQQVIYDEVNDTCFINALVGWGRFCPTLK